MAGAERAAEREQQEAQPATPERAPANVPWSDGSVGRILALQRSAGNAAVSQVLARQPPGGGTATQTPAQPPSPTQPAGGHASLINDPAVERQSETSLRGAARGAMGMAYADFTNACQDVKAQRAAASAQPSFVEQLASIMIGALAPGMAGVVLNVVRSRLMEVAEGVITVAIRERSVALLPGQSADQARTDVTAAARELVDKWITLDGAQAQAGVRAFAQSQAPPAGAPPAGGAPIPVPELIDQFERNYRQQILQAQLQIESLSRAQALGVFAAYARADRHFFMAQINSLVTQHEELARAADDPGMRPFGGIDTEKIVMFEAHGMRRPAILTYDVGQFMVRRSHWRFKKWVSDEMLDTATAVGNAQRVATVGGGSRVAGMEVVVAGQPYPIIPVQGHIPVPGVEGERVVRTDAYGHPRLAYAYIQGSTARFVRWVPQNEVSFAQVQGERQQGGINVIAPGQWQGGLPAPTGANDAPAP